MAVNTAAGSKLYIGVSVVKADADTLAEFVAMGTWTEVGEIQNLGRIGDASNDVTFISLSDGRVRHLKGARDGGTLDTVCGRDPLDAGQVALVAAEATTSEYAFKVVHNDKPTVSGTATTEYFRGLVRSKQANLGSADEVVTRQFSIGVNSEIFEVLAAA